MAKSSWGLIWTRPSTSRLSFDAADHIRRLFEEAWRNNKKKPHPLASVSPVLVIGWISSRYGLGFSSPEISNSIRISIRWKQRKIEDDPLPSLCDKLDQSKVFKEKCEWDGEGEKKGKTKQKKVDRNKSEEEEEERK